MKQWHHVYVLIIALACFGCRGKSRTADEHVLVARQPLPVPGLETSTHSQQTRCGRLKQAFTNPS